MLDRYQEAVTKTVCVLCMQRTGRGICGIGVSEDCALYRFFPEVVGIVKAIDSTVLHDYVHEFHNVVCVCCRENQDGNCKLRGTSECPLDLYFPLIVKTIKEVQEQEIATGTPGQKTGRRRNEPNASAYQ